MLKAERHRRQNGRVQPPNAARPQRFCDAASIPARAGRPSAREEAKVAGDERFEGEPAAAGLFRLDPVGGRKKGPIGGFKDAVFAGVGAAVVVAVAPSGVGEEAEDIIFVEFGEIVAIWVGRAENGPAESREFADVELA
jgi:hypothetical protein